MNDNNKYILSVKKKLTRKTRLFSNTEKIKYLLNKNNGYLTTKELTQNRIARDYLTFLVDYGEIINVERGIYISRKTKEDIYYTFQLRFPKTVYSHLTALYFHKLVNEPDNIQATCINNVFCEGFKKHDIFYVKKEWFNLGIMEFTDKMGYQIKIYDLERTICDMIRSDKRFSKELVNKCIRKYIASENKNIDNLLLYAEKMGIGNKVIEMLKK